MINHHRRHFHNHRNRQRHLANSRRDGIKVFQIRDSATFARLLGIGLMFNLKNIIASTSMGLRDDHLDAMTSIINPPKLHLDSI